MLGLTNIWKDRAVPNKLKVKLMKTLGLDTDDVWGWWMDTQKSDEQTMRGAEMWFYRRLLSVSWTQKRMNGGILEELGQKRQLSELVIRRKLIYFGHAYWHQESGLMKLMFQGKVQWRRGRGCPWTNYISNVTSWIGCNSEHLFKLSHDRERWREASFNAARAAHIKHDDAVAVWTDAHTQKLVRFQYAQPLLSFKIKHAYLQRQGVCLNTFYTGNEYVLHVYTLNTIRNPTS